MNASDLINLSRVSEEAIIARALSILEERARYGAVMDSPTTVKDFLRLRIGGAEHEEFWAVWLDSQNQVIEMEGLFRGTISQTSVYPREVVKSAITLNAAGVIFAHNHPSGVYEPSNADIQLTKALKEALGLIDVRTLDHLIVTRKHVMSFAERGLL